MAIEKRTTGPGPGGSTYERDGPIKSSPAPNAKDSTSLSVLEKPNKKRKASDLGETEDIYHATHTRSVNKQEPGSPIDDSQGHGRSASPSTGPIKQEPGADVVLSGRDNGIANSGEGTSRPLSRRGDSLLVVKEEAASPSHGSKEASDVLDRVSSSDLTEPDMWYVSESEFHTSEAEEDSSDGESLGSAFSSKTERQESGWPNEASRSPDNLNGVGHAKIPSRSRAAQNHNSISRKRHNQRTANASNAMEQDTPARSTYHDYGNNRDESREIPESQRSERINETIVAGKPRKRALTKNHISARDISRSRKTANSADKMLMKMKEQGCGWLEIRKAWQVLTGERPANSTLPNRYNRIKDNLTRLKSGDGQRLLDAAADVEAHFQRTKWEKIAKAMERAGAAKYSKAFIQKKYDELSRNADMLASPTEEESSDASEFGPVPQRDNIERLQQQGAVATMARAQKRSENSPGISHSNAVESGVVPGVEVPALGEDEPPESDRRQNYGRPIWPKLAVSREEIKKMATEKVLGGAKYVVPRPYECQACLGRYRKRSGLVSHWKRNPGCDTERRWSKAAMSASKKTAAELTCGASKD